MELEGWEEEEEEGTEGEEKSGRGGQGRSSSVRVLVLTVILRWDRIHLSVFCKLNAYALNVSLVTWTL